MAADGADGSTEDLNTQEYKIYGSNDKSAWTELEHVTENTEAINTFTYPEKQQFRYIKLEVLKPHADDSEFGANHLRIYEF